MNTQKIEALNIIGISVRTTNENEQAAKDIPALWEKFMSESTTEKIPNKISNEVYCIYTEYESDHTKPYTTILGCKVKSLEQIPTGMIGKTIEKTEYEKFTAKGNLQEGIVYNKWLEIWNKDLNRKFTSDFEIYGEKTMNPKDAEVDIFIAVEN
ncbi:effector binding domain-containing protein [Bernardetia sp. ABR2-2B]|uniref:GyrI-like domain-containing protein n=1 Tax=Bernardetia sp. ABR2-2B TaxID=3127472 RepID=UPI0030CCC880